MYVRPLPSSMRDCSRTDVSLSYKTDLYMYESFVKRDLYCQERPILLSKETYNLVHRDLYMYVRPIAVCDT